MTLNSRTLTAALVLSSSLSMACADGCGDGRASQEGELGELTFTFPVADGQEDFDRPIALGARLRLRVEGLEGESVERVAAATVTPEEVLSAQRSQARGDELVLTARAQGEASLEVEAVLAGESTPRADRVSLRVRPISSSSLEHACTRSPAAAYLTNQPITLDYARFDADGRRMIGEGACEVTVTPDAGLDRTRCDEAALDVPPISDPGPYVVSSSRRAANGSVNRLDVNVVSPELLDFAPIEGSLREGRSDELELLPQTPDWDICTPLEFEVFILTPDVCVADDTSADLFTVYRDENNRVDMRGRNPGTCRFEVRLPALGVQGAWEFSVPVTRTN